MSRTPLREDLFRNRQLPPLGHAWRTLWARVLQHQHRVFGNGKIGIVDACGEIVVVGENDGRACVLPQVRLGGSRLDHGAVGCEVAAQNGEAVVRDERLCARQDHVAIEDFRPRDVVAQRFPVDGLRVEVEQVADFGEQRAQSARVIKILHQIFAGRSNVRDQRRAARESVEAVDREGDAGAARERDQVHDGVGRTAECENRRDRIIDRRRRHEIAWLEVFPDHINDSAAGFSGHPSMSRIGGEDRCGARQRKAQRFGG
jgi:hypothetical protein